MGELRPIRRKSGRPFFCNLIAAKLTAILAHFRRSAIGLEMDPEICHHQPRLGPIKSGPLILYDWSEIPGRSLGNRGQPTANPGGPLSGP